MKSIAKKFWWTCALVIFLPITLSIGFSITSSYVPQDTFEEFAEVNDAQHQEIMNKIDGTLDAIIEAIKGDKENK